MSYELYLTLCSLISFIGRFSSFFCGVLALFIALLWASAPRWRGGRLPLASGLNALLTTLACAALLWLLLFPPSLPLIGSESHGELPGELLHDLLSRFLLPLLAFLLPRYGLKQTWRRSFLSLGVYWMAVTCCHFLTDFSLNSFFCGYGESPLKAMMAHYAERALLFLLLALLLRLCTRRQTPRPGAWELACFAAAFLLLSERLTLLAGFLAANLLPNTHQLHERFLSLLHIFIPVAMVNEWLSALLLLLLGRYILHLSWRRSCLPAILLPFLHLLSGLALCALSSC